MITDPKVIQALKDSVEHHKRVKADPRGAWDKGEGVGAQHCPLCTLMQTMRTKGARCSKCPLGNCGGLSPWDALHGAWNSYVWRHNDSAKADLDAASDAMIAEREK